MPVHEKRLTETFAALISMDSPSYGERAMADELTARLRALGCTVLEDNVAETMGGSAGNLIARLPGDLDLPPLLFSAHMDTVEPSHGKQAVIHPDGRITSAGDTVLGADDVGGLTAILEALAVIQEDHIPHRPLELVFPAAEEVYGAGSKLLDYEALHARECYVLDLDGPMGRAALRAPSIISFRATLHGKAAHAGMAPETGIHAVKLMAETLSRLPLGHVDEQTTVNIGTIQGGLATNIVPETCTVEGEVRGFDHALALGHIGRLRGLFATAAVQAGATLDFSHTVHIRAFSEPEDSPVVRRWLRACRKEGVTPKLDQTFGGSDHNNFAAHGIHGVVVASAMQEVHTTGEWTTVQDLTTLAKLTLALMTDTE